MRGKRFSEEQIIRILGELVARKVFMAFFGLILN